VNDPIRTKFARVSIKPTPVLGSDSAPLNQSRRSFRLSMIFSENRYPLFGIML
jgi:hypothetical protein